MREKEKHTAQPQTEPWSQLSKQMCADGQQTGRGDNARGRHSRKAVVKTRGVSKPTEIEASVFADELQRVHQLSPTQRLCRGHFHNVERQSQCKQQRATGRRHLLDLQGKRRTNTLQKHTSAQQIQSPPPSHTCTHAHISEVMT